jgi:hypothetical protein
MERARVRGKAPCNGQGLGASPCVEPCLPSLRVVDSIGSSQARWFAEGFFPLTPALSPKERENRPPRFRQPRAPRLVAARDAAFPLPALPAGEGEGERGNPIKTPLLSPALSSTSVGSEGAAIRHRTVAYPAASRATHPLRFRAALGLQTSHSEKFDIPHAQKELHTCLS